MKQSHSAAVTLLISVFLLIEGIWGLFSPVIYWVLTLNRTHAIIHIVLGVGGLIARQKGKIRSFFGFLGSLLIVGAGLWFVPATRELPRGLLDVNRAVATLNFILGVVALVVAFTEGASRRTGLPPAPPPPKPDTAPTWR